MSDYKKVKEEVKRYFEVGKYSILNKEPGTPYNITDASMRDMCLSRLKAGEKQWGDEWKKRDNLSECAEELADAINYLCFVRCKESDGNKKDQTAYKEQVEKIIVTIKEAFGNLQDLRGIKHIYELTKEEDEK